MTFLRSYILINWKMYSIFLLCTIAGFILPLLLSSKPYFLVLMAHFFIIRIYFERLEKNKVATFLVSLPINRSTLVFVHYWFIFIYLVLLGLIQWGLYYLINQLIPGVLLQIDLGKTVLILTVIALYIYSLTTPFYYLLKADTTQVRYTTAFLVLLPIYIMTFFADHNNNYIVDGLMQSDLKMILILVVGLFFYFVSMHISKHIFNRREEI